MNSNMLTCPQCQTEFEVSEVMRAQLAADIRSELQADHATKLKKLADERESVAKERQQLETSQAEFGERLQSALMKERDALVAKLRSEAQRDAAIDIADRNEQLKAAQARLKAFETQELELRRQKRELEEQAKQQELDIACRLDEERKTVQAKLEAGYAEKASKLEAEREILVKDREKLKAGLASLDERVATTLEKERDKLAEKLRKEAEQAAAVEITDRDEQLKSAQSRLKAFELQELDLRRQKRELEEHTERQKLEVARQIDEERKTIREAAMKQADEAMSFKLAESNQKIEVLANQLKEAQRRLEQGSQQTQGDVQELALESLLGQLFPGDVIERVGKGDKGGDLLHHVFDANGRECGVILWESKRTKSWNSDWVGKAIDDQQSAKAAVVCIVTAVLPTGIEHLDQKSGVWITQWNCASLVAYLLRQAVVDVAQARAATDGQHGKMEILYNYMASDELRSRLRGIVEPYLEMEQDLRSEMRAINARWKKRRKQLDRVMIGASGLYGDLQGIIGNSLQEIDAMEMLALDAKCQADEAGKEMA